MLVVGHANNTRVPRQFLEHDVDVDQTVAAAVDHHNRRFDVACRELGNLVVLGPLRYV